MFTDEDLKRLKEYNGLIASNGKTIKALLARLEAAEAYIEAKAHAPYKGAKEYEAWREASGKSGGG